jgi:hypothetical protein
MEDEDFYDGDENDVQKAIAEREMKKLEDDFMNVFQIYIIKCVFFW